MNCLWLFTASLRTRTDDVNIGTVAATVKIVFFNSRNAALIERRMLQNKTLSTKLHRCTLS